MWEKQNVNIVEPDGISVQPDLCIGNADTKKCIR